MASLLVTLDDRCRPNCRVVRVQSGVAPSSTLAQEVPALVERNLKRTQSIEFVAGERRTLVVSLQPMLLVGQIANSPHNFRIHPGPL